MEGLSGTDLLYGNDLRELSVLGLFLPPFIVHKRGDERASVNSRSLLSLTFFVSYLYLAIFIASGIRSVCRTMSCGLLLLSLDPYNTGCLRSKHFVSNEVPAFILSEQNYQIE